MVQLTQAIWELGFFADLMILGDTSHSGGNGHDITYMQALGKDSYCTTYGYDIPDVVQPHVDAYAKGEITNKEFFQRYDKTVEQLRETERKAIQEAHERLLKTRSPIARLVGLFEDIKARSISQAIFKDIHNNLSMGLAQSAYKGNAVICLDDRITMKPLLDPDIDPASPVWMQTQKIRQLRMDSALSMQAPAGNAGVWGKLHQRLENGEKIIVLVDSLRANVLADFAQENSISAEIVHFADSHESFDTRKPNMFMPAYDRGHVLARDTGTLKPLPRPSQPGFSRPNL